MTRMNENDVYALIEYRFKSCQVHKKRGILTARVPRFVVSDFVLPQLAVSHEEM